LLVYGIISAIRAEVGKKQLAWAAGAAAIAIVVSIRAADDYESTRNLATPDEWFSSKAKGVGQRLRAEVSRPGPVLTLAPAVALSGDLAVYPEFATGVFAWRSAHHVAVERRHKMHLVAPEDLEGFLSTHPPAAVLTGVEDPDEEEPLVKWAERHGFRPVDMKKRRRLWLPPRT
jgi:hypothetical protein